MIHKQTTFLLSALGAVAVLIVGASQVSATIITQKDSADFGTYKYEMDVLPTTQDLDGNSANDMEFFEGSGTTSGGVMTLSSDARLRSATATQAWGVLAPTSADGYTVEVRLKVNSQTGADAALALIAGEFGSNSNSWLNIGANDMKWMFNGSQPISSADNSDGFHVIRVAKAANEGYYNVWRDGVLLDFNGNPDLTNAWNNGNDKFNIGNVGSKFGGDIDIDYLRFTSGAFAPAAIPEPSSLLLTAVAGLCGLATRRRRSL